MILNLRISNPRGGPGLPGFYLDIVIIARFLKGHELLKLAVLCLEKIWKNWVGRFCTYRSRPVKLVGVNGSGSEIAMHSDYIDHSRSYFIYQKQPTLQTHPL